MKNLAIRVLMVSLLVASGAAGLISLTATLSTSSAEDWRTWVEWLRSIPSHPQVQFALSVFSGVASMGAWVAAKASWLLAKRAERLANAKVAIGLAHKGNVAQPVIWYRVKPRRGQLNRAELTGVLAALTRAKGFDPAIAGLVEETLAQDHGPWDDLLDGKAAELVLAVDRPLYERAWSAAVDDGRIKEI